MKPLIRWAGSKSAIITELRTYWTTAARRYVEPFAGSACLYFDLRPERALLADLNAELICTYRAVRRDPSLVIQCLRRLPVGRDPYYAIRSINPSSLSEPELAARFLYLNRNCFNGLYRTNQAGVFNVPYGPPKATVDNSRQRAQDFEQRIMRAAEALEGVTLLNADFEVVLSQVEPGDFVYLDPPYVVEDRRIFTEYLPGSFSGKDLGRLSEQLHRINDLGATFLVSYADSKEATVLLRPWSQRRVWTRRNIAGFVGARRGSYELLATNFQA